MPKFKKLIVTPGVHNVGRLGGRSEAVAITPERIREWVQNTNRIMELGVSVPAPFAHQDSKGNFPLPVVRLGDDGASLADAYNPANGLTWDAQVNGGFWDDAEKFAIDPDTQGLVGIVDAPGDAADPNTPAGKVGTVVKETSVLVMGPRIIRGKDGKDHQIGEHLAHVAMCLHPAQPGQRNFEPVTDSNKQFSPDDLKVAMSFAMSDLMQANAGAPGIMSGNGLPDPTKPQDQELMDTIAMLATVTYISLPPTTSREDFITNLNLCLRQKSADQQEKQKEEESLTTKPNGAETKSPTIAMSQVTSNGFIPMTQQNSNSAATPSSSDTMLVLFMSNIVKDRKKTLKERIAQLVATGRCKQEYANTKLLPKVEAFTMSVEQLQAAGGDASNVHADIEDVIEALEQTQPLAGGSQVDLGAEWATPPGSTVEEVPSAGLPDLTDEQADEIINESQLQYS